MKTALPIGLTTALLAINIGCSTHQGHVMSDVASMASEPHRTWSRPVELGYEVIGDVQGEATAQSVLGIRIGAETGGVGIGILGAITGEQQVDPIVQSASYNAVVSAGADAIYITRWEIRKTGLPPLFQTKTAEVHGKALRLLDYGPVDQERNDTYRLEQAGSGRADNDTRPPPPPPPAPPTE